MNKLPPDEKLRRSHTFLKKYGKFFWLIPPIFLFSVLTGVYIAINSTPTNQQPTHPFTPSQSTHASPPTPTQYLFHEPNASPTTANWKMYSLGNLTLRLPPTWWVEKSKNIFQKEANLQGYWISINPTSLENNTDVPASFYLWYFPNTGIAKVRQYITTNSSNIQEKTIENPNGTLYEAMTQGGVLNPREVNIFISADNKGTYYFEEAKEMRDQKIYFDQILSTFQFNK